MKRTVGIVGGGGFGRALGRAVVRGGGQARLWSRRQAAPLDGVECTTDMAAMAGCELVFVAVPSMHVAQAADALGHHIDGRHLLVHVSRGVVGEGLTTVSRVLRERTPARRVGCLAGPIQARTLEDGVPGGGIVGSGFPEVYEAVHEALGGPSLRLYQTDDVKGTELSSAFVGLLALAIGFARQLGVGPGALAVLATRGMVEASRVGVSLGGDERTFSGLAGYGDLIAAIAGDGRPELALGEALGRGLSPGRAAEEAGAYIEGISIARNLQRYAARRGIEVPITDALADALEGKLSPPGVIERLMSRRVRHE